MIACFGCAHTRHRTDILSVKTRLVAAGLFRFVGQRHQPGHDKGQRDGKQRGITVGEDGFVVMQHTHPHGRAQQNQHQGTEQPRETARNRPRVVSPFQNILSISTGKLADAANAKANPTIKATF